MRFRYKFVIILLFLLFLNISVASANNDNATEIIRMADEEVIEVENRSEESISQDLNSAMQSNETNYKSTPKITVDSTKVYSKDTLEINLLSSTHDSLASKKLIVNLNNKVYTLKTNSEGVVKLPINLAAKPYKLTVSFEGDDKYNSISKVFKIDVVKIKTKLTPSANFVVKGNYFYFHLVDGNGNSLAHQRVTIKLSGKTHKMKTNSYGRVKIKINSKINKNYAIKAKFSGDSQYGASSKKIKFKVTSSRSISIGNNKLLTKGFLRIYLKINGKAVSKNVILTIGNKKLSKKANSEGIVIFKPNVKVGHYTVKAQVGNYYSMKNMKCYEGNVKDPLKESSTYNGKPDIDVMPGNYAMGDGNAKYTLKKSQYREVLKRDSYCLFLHGKLTKYTFFKTKNYPKLNHIIKREKWNVIEMAVNTKLVKKNKYGYWPGSISVSLKGKSYKYPYVKDSQNTAYTCGPTSCSMCSQVLKNYVCEKYMTKLSKTDKTGTSCPNMIKALSKNNFVATYFYKSTFNQALKELKKGGCALIFHAYNHYVCILDISSNGKNVLVSNSYASYDHIPTKWLKVSYMKNRFSHKWDESLIVKLNYKLSDSTINSINNYYSSMGKNWVVQNTSHGIGHV